MGLCRVCDQPGHNSRTCPNKPPKEDDDMARKKMANGESSVTVPPVTLSEVDEQVDADLDEGDADMDAVLKAGAVSAESVAYNEQTKNIITGKRANSKRIRWNDHNAQMTYDSIRQAGWNTASLYISCKRVTGGGQDGGPQWSTPCSAIATSPGPSPSRPAGRAWRWRTGW